MQPFLSTELVGGLAGMLFTVITKLAGKKGLDLKVPRCLHTPYVIPHPTLTNTHVHKLHARHPRTRELSVCFRAPVQVQDPEKLHFRPKEMLLQVVTNVLHLAPFDAFVDAVVDTLLVDAESAWSLLRSVRLCLCAS
jgi:hypothetical protein